MGVVHRAACAVVVCGSWPAACAVSVLRKFGTVMPNRSGRKTGNGSRLQHPSQKKRDHGSKKTPSTSTRTKKKRRTTTGGNGHDQHKRTKKSSSSTGPHRAHQKQKMKKMRIKNQKVREPRSTTWRRETRMEKMDRTPLTTLRMVFSSAST